MATHDYIIDNQSASAFRSDLNGALQAVVTQNSNATAPSTTYANMIWYDTAANQLKKRNEADSAWIVLGTIDEGTGTFTPSGERALASEVQAEAGTNNTTLMTPLRTAQAIAVLSPAPSTTAGDVGTYAYLISNANSDTTFGGTVAGSTLFPAGTSSAGNSTDPNFGDNNSGNFNTQNSARSGTWRCMGKSGYYTTGTGGRGDPVKYFYGATLWLRIS